MCYMRRMNVVTSTCAGQVIFKARSWLYVSNIKMTPTKNWAIFNVFFIVKQGSVVVVLFVYFCDKYFVCFRNVRKH